MYNLILSIQNKQDISLDISFLIAPVPNELQNI